MRKILAALLLLAATAAFGQTTVSRAVAAGPVLLLPSGTTLPSNCNASELFFKLDATAGQNLYECASANTWTQQLNSGSSGNITIGTSTITSGTSGRVLYDSAGVIGEMTTTGSGTVLALATSPTLVTPVLGAATATSVNGLTVTSSTGTLTITNGKTLSAAKTLTLDGTDSTTMTFPSVSATIPRTVASGTSALGTSAISSAACATVVTTAATGTLTTDVIAATFNADPTSTTGYSASASGMLTIVAYPSADNVNFKVCNNTGSSITPGAVTLNWRVTR